MKLLLVDDSRDDRILVEHALLYAKFPVEFNWVQSVEEANETLLKENFDTVILSAQIPGWDSMELLLDIKNHAGEKQTAIVMLSDVDNHDLALKCIRSGAHDFIIKSDISAKRLQRAVIHATARSELELKLRQSYERVKFLAEHDALTCTSNRYMFDMSLQNAVELGQLQHTCVGLVIINPDRFKFINDTYGHEAGDAVLVELTSRLKAILKRDEQLFRLGGDEFAILLTNLAYAHLGGLHQRINEALNAPMQIGEFEIKLTLSLGVAFNPQNCDSASSLHRCADIAMFRAKQLGGNTICFVDDDAQEQFKRRFNIENELQRAIENDEFELHFQPVMCSDNMSLESCEALIRWNHPEKGLVFPDYFIEVAEETGMVVELGRWIIESACAHMARWQRHKPVDFVMAINISPQQLNDKHLVSFLDKKLSEYGLRPQQFELEITETVLLRDTPEVFNNLQTLIHRGFGIALDDFGTGYSSIQHLHSFPISTVKIDRSLMPTPTSTKKSLSLLKGLMSMIKSMDLSIVAEGIENLGNANLCRDLGADRLQGYFFSKPLPANTFEQDYLYTRRARQVAV
ncbi:MAG: EAL domain-containing protein [Alteromonadaceae bacterium]|nr:EAL domain-containing protein [Alteromonadaceae bacterium]